MELVDAIHSEGFDARKLSRSKEDCFEHWLELWVVILGGEVDASDGLIIETIRQYYNSLESEAGPSTGPPIGGDPRLSRSEAEKMIPQYLKRNEKINTGLDRTKEECEVCIREIIAWLAKKKGLTTKGLASAAVRDYQRHHHDSDTQLDRG